MSWTLPPEAESEPPAQTSHPVSFDDALERTRAFHSALLQRLLVHSPELEAAAWLEAAACSEAGRAHYEADGLSYVPCDAACRKYIPSEHNVSQVQLTLFPKNKLDKLSEGWSLCLPGRSWKCLRLECPEGSCPGSFQCTTCYNKFVLTNRFNSRVAVAPCASLLGFGMFATQALPAETFVGEYKGKISTYDEWVLHIKRVKESRGQHTEWPYVPEELYGMSITEDLTGVDFLIDGFEHGSAVRFVNHSCQPNCSIEFVLSQPADAAPRVAAALFTKRSIEPYEQLSINYLWFEDSDSTNETTVSIKEEASKLVRQHLGDDYCGIDDLELEPTARQQYLIASARLIGIPCHCGSDFSLNPSGKCCGVIGDMNR